MCVGEEVLPAVLYAAAFHSFSPLTLFDCERRRRRSKVGKGGTGGASSLLHSRSFHFGRWGTGKEGKKRRGTDLCWPVRNYLTTPSLTLVALCFLSLSIQPPTSSSSSECFFTPLPANLHYSPLCPPSFLLFLSHLPLLLLLGQRYLARLIVM